MSGLLSPCMCSVMSVVLLFSILTTACSISPTALTLRSCTRQPNGEQLVSKSINQSIISINQSIKRKGIFGLHICDLWKVDGGTSFIRWIPFIGLVICWVIHFFISFILIPVGCHHQNCLTRPGSYEDRVDQLSSAIMSGHMRTTLLAKLLCRNGPSAAIVGQEKQNSWQNLICLRAP